MNHTPHQQAAPAGQPTLKRSSVQTLSAMRCVMSNATFTIASIGANRNQEAKQYCRDVVQVLQALKDKRDMTFNEVRLIVQIEDPRAREQRRTMDIEVRCWRP